MARKKNIKGDPDGRRLAKRRADLLSEAARVARCLEILLARADFDGAACADLIQKIGIRERIELQKAFGRIEPRLRSRGNVSAPLLEHRPISSLYIDEGGKSHPKTSGETVFSLGAVALSDEACTEWCNGADEIKREFFGRTDFAFHDPWMRKRYQTTDDPPVDYSFGTNVQRQEEFDQAIAALLKRTPFVVFGVGIRKHAYSKEFVEAGLDPYLPTDIYALAIVLLFERYVDALSHDSVRQMGKVTFETCGPKEDAYHQLEYARLLMDGSQWVRDSDFRNWLHTGLEFQPKAGSSPLEIADLLARDIFEWTRDDCAVTPKWWSVFSSRVYVRGDGQMGKFGIKIFPTTPEIEERVQAHRKAWGAVELGEN